MREHLEAWATALASLGYNTQVVYAADAPNTYLVLSGPAWGLPDQMPVCSHDGTLEADVRVKAVTGTPAGVMGMLARVRALSSPDGALTPLPVSGRSASLQFVRSEFVDVDTSTTITGTNRHPAQGVDTYHLVSQPA